MVKKPSVLLTKKGLPPVAIMRWLLYQDRMPVPSKQELQKAKVGLNKSQLSPGMYVCHVRTGNVGKLLGEHEHSRRLKRAHPDYVIVAYVQRWGKHKGTIRVEPWHKSKLIRYHQPARKMVSWKEAEKSLC